AGGRFSRTLSRCGDRPSQPPDSTRPFRPVPCPVSRPRRGGGARTPMVLPAPAGAAPARGEERRLAEEPHRPFHPRRTGEGRAFPRAGGGRTDFVSASFLRSHRIAACGFGERS